MTSSLWSCIERTERAIEMQRFILDRLRTNDSLSGDEEAPLTERRNQLLGDLEASKEILEAIRSTTTFFDREIAQLETERDELRKRAGVLTQRMEQLSLVFSELDGEEEILTANVQATDLLRQFCERPDCQMFASSERRLGGRCCSLRTKSKI